MEVVKSFFEARMAVMEIRGLTPIHRNAKPAVRLGDACPMRAML